MKRILIIDDEEMLTTLSRALLDARYPGQLEIVSIADGFKANAHIATADVPPYDLLITDIAHQGTGAGTLLKLARSRWPDIKAIVSSGAAPEIVSSVASTEGFDAVIAKPFDIQAFASTVGGLIGLE